MAAAVDEISHYSEFDYLVVNDEFDQALADLESIVAGKGSQLSWRIQRKNLQILIDRLLSN